jgi:hypothetical protein
MCPLSNWSSSIFGQSLPIQFRILKSIRLEMPIRFKTFRFSLVRDINLISLSVVKRLDLNKIKIQMLIRSIIRKSNIRKKNKGSNNLTIKIK